MVDAESKEEEEKPKDPAEVRKAREKEGKHIFIAATSDLTTYSIVPQTQTAKRLPSTRSSSSGRRHAANVKLYQEA